MRNVVGVVFLLMWSVLVTAQAPIWKQTEEVNGRKAVLGDVLVQFKAAAAEKRHEISTQDRAQSESLSIADIRATFQAEYVNPIGGAGWYLVHSSASSSAALLKGISSRADVEYVEPNYLLEPALSSIAQYYAPYQWALNNTGQSISGPGGVVAGTPGADIKASQAWDLTTGSGNIVIATIDPTGIDYTHPDLAPNVWSAPSSYTVTVGGVQYTCPAGSHGFQFINSGQPACDPLERSGQSHGTILAGIMGANGASSIGVSGVNWTTSMIHIDGATTADVVDGIDFLIQTKSHFGAAANIRVINNSYLISNASQAVLDEINVANSNDMLFVAAAGNFGHSNDVSGVFPASFGAPPYNAPNVVAVANSDNRDRLCDAIECPGVPSDWGSQSVHLAAPGWAIASTELNGGYNVNQLYLAGESTGTSASSPYVVGTAALTLSRCADLNTAQLKQDILDNVDFISGLYGCYNTNGVLDYCTITRGTTPSGQAGGGRLNAYKSASACGFALMIKKGAGTVTSNVSGTVAGALLPINCGSTCSAVFKSSTYGGSSVVLTATAANGYTFLGWTGACSGTASTCTVSGTSASKLVGTIFSCASGAFCLAVFPGSQAVSPGASTAYRVNVTKPMRSTTGPVTLSVTGLPAGSSANFNPSSVNVGTFGGNSTLTITTTGSTPIGTYTLTITGTNGTESHSATVNLAVRSGLTFTLNVTGTGSVSSPAAGIACSGPTCTYVFSSGYGFTLTEQTFPGNGFVGWSGACTGTSTTCSVVMDSAKTVGASFQAF
jgi:hypothetical protein